VKTDRLTARVRALLPDTVTYQVQTTKVGDVHIACPSLSRQPVQTHDHLDSARSYLKRHDLTVRTGATREYRGRRRLVSLLVLRADNLEACYVDAPAKEA